MNDNPLSKRIREVLEKLNITMADLDRMFKEAQEKKRQRKRRRSKVEEKGR